MDLISFMERDLDIADYFVSDDATKMCPIIKAKENNETSAIGSGAQGAVYRIVIDGKAYVVKKTRNYSHTFESDYYEGSTMKLEDVIRLRRDLFPKYYPPEMVYDINHSFQQKMKDKKKAKFAYPKLKEGWDKCLTDETISVETRKNMSSYRYDTFVYPEGSNICDNGNYSEALCSLLCSKLFTSGKCANFTEVFGVNVCAQESYSTLPNGEKVADGVTVYDCTVMEMLDKNAYDNLGYKKDLWVENLDYITIQVLFAMSCMQRVHGIQHNDLHFGNVMFKQLSDGTRFNGIVLSDADYFSYTIDDKKVYLPNKGYIIKIIDFGFSTKYSHPIVGYKSVVNGKTFADGWRNDYYDILRFVQMYPHKVTTALIETIFESNGTKRPWEYLTNTLDEVYYTKPTSGRIVSLGTLGEDDYYRGFFTLEQSIPPSKVSMSTFDDYELLTIILGNNVSQNKTAEEELVEFVASVRRKPQSFTLFFLDTSRRAMVISARLMCIIQHYLKHNPDAEHRLYLEDRMYEIETRIEDFKTKITI